MGIRKRNKANILKDKKKKLAIAKLRNCPISPRKMRSVADLLRGKEVGQALNILKFNYRMTMIRCALESPDLGQAFKYSVCHHITHRKFFRGT